MSLSASKFSSDKYRFSFAIISDTHVKPESGDDSSPYKVNKLANGRARWIAREITRYDPAFVIHLGDLVHPLPELPTRGAGMELFRSVFRQHQDRLHVVAGNHDVGDKPNRAMPVKTVRDEWVTQHERCFGPSWNSFDHDDVRFVLINSVILNTGTERERAQRRWLEETLSSAGGRRIFMFMHYALFVLQPSEESNYDNIDEPARADLLNLIRKHRVEAVIAGHVHNISYHRLGGTELYVMPATSFVRQDYAEMYRAEAIHENGRNDAEKLGFAIVDVYRDGHIVNYIPSYGETLAPDESVKPVAARSSQECFPNPKRGSGAPFGAFLRHSWADTIMLPYNGPMDEFARKEVRNDYQVAALWRMGIQHARVPLADFLNVTARARIADLVEMGHRFTAFGFGIPTAALDTLCAHANLIDRYECVLPSEAIRPNSKALADFRARIGRPVLLSRVDSSADHKNAGSRFVHFVAHGFAPEELSMIEQLRKEVSVDGFVIRADLGTDLVRLATNLDEWSARNQCKIDLHLRLASTNMAENILDDGRILANVVELFAVGLAFPRLTTMVDTFMDIDRGYFVRHGLIDRRCNLQPAGLAVEALSAFLGGGSETWSLTKCTVDGVTLLSLCSPKRNALLAIPNGSATKALKPHVLQTAGLDLAASTLVWLDRPWAIEPHLGSRPSTVALPSSLEAPILIVGSSASSV